MTEAVNFIICLCTCAVLLAGVVWLHILADRAEAEEDEQLRREIAHLPADVKVQLWAAHIRLKAEKDLR